MSLESRLVRVAAVSAVIVPSKDFASITRGELDAHQY